MHRRIRGRLCRQARLPSQSTGRKIHPGCNKLGNLSLSNCQRQLVII